MAIRTLQAPLVHLNGTGKERLIDAIEGAVHAIGQALEAMAEVYPNARDYYPLRAGAYEQALKERVMPKDLPHTARLDRKALLAAMERVKALSKDQGDPPVSRFTLNGNAKVEGAGEVGLELVLPCEWSGPTDMAVAVNAGYVADYCRAHPEAGMVEWRLKDPKSAGMFMPGNYVLMPFRV